VSIRALEVWKEKEVLKNYLIYNLMDMRYFKKKLLGLLELVLRPLFLEVMVLQLR